MVGPGDVRDYEPVGGRHSADSLETELERLRRLVVQTMDSLAEQVLDQIQTTRSIADRTEEVLDEVRSANAGAAPVDASEVHLQRASALIEDAMRNLPESSWDEFA